MWHVRSPTLAHPKGKIMPYGRKEGIGGREVNFQELYKLCPWSRTRCLMHNGLHSHFVLRNGNYVPPYILHGSSHKTEQ